MFAREPGQVFRAPKRTLGDLTADNAAKLIAAASDVALIIDAKGIIRDIALGNDELSKDGFADWVGERWIDTVTIESREKIEALLNDAAAAKNPMRWRQVNHPSSRGDIPIRYSAVQIGPSGRVVAVGRDLRTVATLQQRLVDAQQSMEREYARLRHAETRYRLLFQIASEPVLIVDSNTLKLVDANPAAAQILNRTNKRLAGKGYLEFIDPENVRTVQSQLSSLRATGRADDVTVRLAGSKLECVASASLFRQENSAHILVRLSALHADENAAMAKTKFFNVVESLPDGFVVTDLDRRILTANPAFLDLAQLSNEQLAKGQLLDRWVGRQGIDINALVGNIRDHGAVRNFSTVLRGELGTYEEIEVSGVSVLTGDQPCYGFTFRSVQPRHNAPPRSANALPRSVEQLTGLVGRVSLKELVRETTDVIEKLCIEAALKLTHDNRASAAEMLGLSRQSLYSKLRRFGIDDADDSQSH